MEDLFYKNTLMNAPFGYAYHRVVVDGNNCPVDYEFLEVNRAFEKLTGLKSPNILGRTVKEVIPDITQSEFDWIAYYGNIALKCEQVEFEQYLVPHKQWYSVQAYSNKKYFFSTIFTDITKRKQIELDLQESEARFRLLYEQAPVAYQSLDEQGCFLDVNQRWLESLGYDKAQVLGKSFSEFLHPDFKNNFKENFPKFKKIGAVDGVEFQILKQNGELMLVTFNGRIGYDGSGNFKQTHCIFQDITKQRRLEKEKEKMQMELIHTSKLATLGTMAAGVAHEINNPLAIITGAVDMIDGKHDQLEEQELLKLTQMIRSSVSRISQIVKGLKIYARKDPEDLGKINIHEEINETLLFLKGVYKKENIEIKTNLTSLHPNLLANQGKFQQVIINLLNNAKDALFDKENGEIVISTKDMNNKLRVEISDNGSGMSDHVLSQLFDPFFTTKAPGKGTGLGLPICQSIIESFGGKIEVNTKTGLGSTFSLIFPLK